jgi:GNAT superfamily N-acetyltransferase
MADVRTASKADLDGLTAVITAAFAEDPLWRWAFAELRDLEVWWRFLISSVLRYPNTYIAGDFAAAAVWVPPGGVELTEEEEARVPRVLEQLVGERAADVLALLGEFDGSHPHDQEHYYLSLLGTDPRERGKGIGMGLLAHCLEIVDAEGLPAYLESSNPANDARYERLGFAPHGSFSTPDGRHSVTTMWREPR